jgi:transcriptional regulator with XRE-family HTH domain
MSVSKRVLELLSNDKSLSQKGLAQAIGVAPSTLSNWLLKNRDIPPEKLIPICEYLGISVNTLLTGNEDPAEEPAVPAGIDPLLMRLISRLNRDQQIELRGYVKRMLDEPVAEGSSEVHAKAAK